MGVLNHLIELERKAAKIECILLTLEAEYEHLSALGLKANNLSEQIKELNKQLEYCNIQTKYIKRKPENIHYKFKAFDSLLNEDLFYIKTGIDRHMKLNLPKNMNIKYIIEMIDTSLLYAIVENPQLIEIIPDEHKEYISELVPRIQKELMHNEF